MGSLDDLLVVDGKPLQETFIMADENSLVAIVKNGAAHRNGVAAAEAGDRFGVGRLMAGRGPPA